MIPGESQQFITRDEYRQFTKLYEVRHSELRLEIKDLESGLKIDLSSMTVKLDSLSTQLARRGADGWKLMATSSLSLIAGYVLFYLQHVFIK